MIKRLKLERWRAYEYTEIPFETGTTFLVAANGIGKTSLLEAARFALTGVCTGESPVMLGRADAKVELTLGLDETTELTIARTLRAGETESSELSARKNNKELTAKQLAAELAASFDTTAEFIARNAFLCDSLIDVGPLDVRSLLTRAFMLDERRAEANELDAAAAILEEEAVQLGRSIRSEAQQQGQLLADLKTAMASQEQATEALVQARAEMDQVTEARALFLQTAALVEQTQRWDAASAALLTTAKALIPSVVPDDLAVQVENLVAEAEAAVATVREEVASAQARIDLIDAALADLDAAGTDCPVCLRPLGDEDRATAAASHAAEAARLRDVLASVDVTAASARVEQARAMLRQVDALGPRPQGPPVGFAPVDPQSEFDDTRQKLEAAVRASDEATTLVERLNATLAEAKAGEEMAAASEKAWRRWALTHAAARTLHQSIDDALEHEILPVQVAVIERWNSLFPDRRDLHFDLDGRQWRYIGDEKLWDGAFSAGERTSARLLLQLAILTAATKVKFCWLDEPLEHLDPRTRRLVAGMLADASEATGLTQLVVTTYEVDLASQLVKASGNTAIEWVRAGPMEQPD